MARTKFNQDGICAVCGRPSRKMICDTCAQQIQAEAIETKEEVERLGGNLIEELEEGKLVSRSFTG